MDELLELARKLSNARARLADADRALIAAELEQQELREQMNKLDHHAFRGIQCHREWFASTVRIRRFIEEVQALEKRAGWVWAT